MFFLILLLFYIEVYALLHSDNNALVPDYAFLDIGFAVSLPLFESMHLGE